MNQQIVNPRVPYIGPVGRGDFSPGKSIIIKGWPPSTANRFNINLQCGPATTPPYYAIALQIAVHLLDGHITLNSFENGIWGEEQRGTLPIQCSKNFEIVITSDFLQYKVTIDGQHYAEFPHRIYYDRITHLAINGNVSISEISYDAISRSEIEGISGYGVAAVPLPSVPIPSKENDRYNRPPYSDSSAPPTYEAAIELSKKAPYPISDPLNMPYIPNNTGADLLPYPIASRTDYYQLPCAIGVHAPLIQPTVIPSRGDDARVALTIQSSNTQSVQSENRTFADDRCYLIIIGAMACIILIVKTIISLKL